MNVRDIKLSIACGHESDEIKSLNKFFDDLFKDVKIYTKDNKPDLIFMNGDNLIMQQDLKSGFLYCTWIGFWYDLRRKFKCNEDETQEIIQYVVDEYFKICSLTPKQMPVFGQVQTEEYFKNGELAIFI